MTEEPNSERKRESVCVYVCKREKGGRADRNESFFRKMLIQFNKNCYPLRRQLNLGKTRHGFKLSETVFSGQKM